MAKFEFVSRFLNAGLPLPTRKTKESAGYDLVAAEDVMIPPYHLLNQRMTGYYREGDVLELSHLAEVTKRRETRPTLVSTGVKAKLDPGTYLELSVRSSTPLKHWLVLANGVGIIDADYYNNPDNEGEIFLQLINLSPYELIIRKGEAIGQAIIKPYLITEDDNASGQRMGGFGSTSNV